MNTQTTLATNDLILRLAGGQRDGELISISNNKCLLGLKSESDTSQVGSTGHCAIYRGPAGVAVQSHGNDVLVNGAATSVHWLREGDRIQLPNSHAVEVMQLGSVSDTPYADSCEPETQFEPAATTPVECDETQTCDTDPQPVEHEFAETPVEAAAEEIASEEPGFMPVEVLAAEEPVFIQPEMEEAPAAELPNTEENSSEYYSATVDGDRIDFIEQENPADSITPAALVAPEPACESQPTADTAELDQRFQTLESSIESIRHESSDANRRFDRLESTLDDLTEKLERLMSVALDNQNVAVANEPAEEASDVINALVDTPAPAEDSAEKEVAPSVSEPIAEPSEAADANNELQQVFAKLVDPTSVPAPSDIETTPEAVVEPPAVVADPEVVAEETSAAYEATDIQSLFNELSAPAESVSNSEVGEFKAEPIAEEVEPIVAEVSELPSPILDLPPIDQAPPESDENTNPSETTGLAERLLDSIRQEEIQAEELPPAELDASISTEEVAEEPIPAEVVSADDSSRTPVRTASVAEIFARLHAESSDGDKAESPALASRTPVATDTSFEEIQASLTAAFQQELPPVKAESDLDLVAEVTPPATETPAVETESGEASTDSASQNVADMMTRLRAGGDLDNEEQADDVSNATEANADETESVDTAAPKPVREQQDSVTDYMSMLLSRMKGGDAAANASDAVATESVSVQEIESAETPAAETQTGLMTEEEFRPKQKPTQIASFDKMRELANASSRSAIDRSIKAQQHERSRSLILQSVSVGSLALGGIFVFSQAYYCAAAFLSIFALSFGYFCYETVKPMVPAKVASKSPKAKATIATTEVTQAAEVTEVVEATE